MFYVTLIAVNGLNKNWLTILCPSFPSCLIPLNLPKNEKKKTFSSNDPQDKHITVRLCDSFKVPQKLWFVQMWGDMWAWESILAIKQIVWITMAHLNLTGSYTIFDLPFIDMWELYYNRKTITSPPKKEIVSTKLNNRSKHTTVKPRSYGFQKTSIFSYHK